MKTKLTSLALSSTVLLAGCNLAPDYQRPGASIENALPQQGIYAGLTTQDASAVSQLPWQQFVLEPRLQQVITIALAQNRDLQSTYADVLSARASYQADKADQWPALTGNASASRSKKLGSVTSSAEANLGVSAFELDFWGSARNQTAAQWQTFLSEQETARAAQLSLVAETATAWLTLAADQQLLTLAQQTMDSADKALSLAQLRLKNGIDSAVDVADAQTTYQSARADVASYRTQVAQAMNALNLLAGTTLANELLPQQLPAARQSLAQVPIGLASDVLLARPDVMAAEHKLIASNANIGVARAAFFPSLSLTATGGVASNSLSDLFNHSSGAWSFSPALSVPIFDFGANRANLNVAKAAQQKAVADYQYAIQTAFSEVADALARRATIDEQLAAQSAQVSAAQRSYELSNLRYKQGVDSLQSALQYQRTFYAAQQSEVNTQLTALSNRITLFRVLGGGAAVTELPELSHD